MKALPKTLEKTQRTATVQCVEGGPVYKMRRTRANKGGSFVWSCAALGLDRVTRLEAEVALLNLAGNSLLLSQHQRSLQGWSL
jgi:hypothetical protein